MARAGHVVRCVALAATQRTRRVGVGSAMFAHSRSAFARTCVMNDAAELQLNHLSGTTQP